MEQQPTWMAEKLVGALEQVAELSARVTALEAKGLSRENDERDEANRTPLRHSLWWQMGGWAIALASLITAWIESAQHH
jgi:hypothetical protein